MNAPHPLRCRLKADAATCLLQKGWRSVRARISRANQNRRNRAVPERPGRCQPQMSSSTVHNARHRSQAVPMKCQKGNNCLVQFRLRNLVGPTGCAWLPDLSSASKPLAYDICASSWRQEDCRQDEDVLAHLNMAPHERDSRAKSLSLARAAASPRSSAGRCTPHARVAIYLSASTLLGQWVGSEALFFLRPAAGAELACE